MRGGNIREIDCSTYRLRSCVAQRRPILVEKVQQFLADEPREGRMIAGIIEIDWIQTWQPAEDLSICSCQNCVVFQDIQLRVGRGTQCHKHNQSLLQDELPLPPPGM